MVIKKEEGRVLSLTKGVGQKSGWDSEGRGGGGRGSLTAATDGGRSIKSRVGPFVRKKGKRGQGEERESGGGRKVVKKRHKMVKWWGCVGTGRKKKEKINTKEGYPITRKGGGGKSGSARGGKIEFSR